MKKSEFIDLFVEELEIEDIQITVDTELKSLAEWDSLAVLSVIAIASDNFNCKITAQQLKDVKKISDIIELIGLDNFEN
jgi:acyl carrier protein